MILLRYNVRSVLFLLTNNIYFKYDLMFCKHLDLGFVFDLHQNDTSIINTRKKITNFLLMVALESRQEDVRTILEFRR